MRPFAVGMKYVRLSQGITLRILSKRTGIHTNTLHQYESDRCAPSVYMAKKIADALGVNVNYLMKYKEIKQWENS